MPDEEEPQSSEEMLREVQEWLDEEAEEVPAAEDGEREAAESATVMAGAEEVAYDTTRFGSCPGCGSVIARDLERCPHCGVEPGLGGTGTAPGLAAGEGLAGRAVTGRSRPTSSLERYRARRHAGKVLLGGAAILVVGVVLLAMNLVFLAGAEQTTGVVVHTWSGYGVETGEQHHRTVEFTTSDGQEVSFDALGHGQVGDEVTVVYDPDTPTSSAKVKDFPDMWRWPAVALATGTGATAVAGFILFRDRRRPTGTQQSMPRGG